MTRVYAIPLHTRFRRTDVREGLLLRGPCGWGEFSPFPEYPPAVCARWLAAAEEAANRPWPPARRTRIPVNVTVPAVGAEQAHRIVSGSGCRTAKVKVAEPGQTAADDLARVEAVRDALGWTGRLRVDANGAWDIGTAVRMIRRLEAFDLEYVEQPVASLAEMAALRRRVDVPLAVDESVRTAQDPLRVAGQLRSQAPVGLEAADVVVLKVQPLGGVHAALRVAEAGGLPVVVSSALETSVGLAAGVALAAALPELPYACGLGTVSLLTGDVVAEPLVPVDGGLAVRRPQVDEVALVRHEADAATRDRWLARLDAARAVAS